MLKNKIALGDCRRLFVYFLVELHRTGDLSGTQTTGAGVHSLGGAVNDRLYAADIGLPAAVGPSVGVGHTNTKGNTLAAEITFCHGSAPPSCLGHVGRIQHSLRQRKTPLRKATGLY